MQEILVVVAIALAIFFVPRLMGRKSSSEEKQHSISPPRFKSPSDTRARKTGLTGRMRLAILMTFVWVSACAAFLKPWEGSKWLFIFLSLGPVTVFWGGVWVWFGYKKYRR